jgi:hypothetical protein
MHRVSGSRSRVQTNNMKKDAMYRVSKRFSFCCYGQPQ